MKLLMKLLEMIMSKDKAQEGDAASGYEKPDGAEGGEESKDGIKEVICKLS